jgi:tricorn protease
MRTSLIASLVLCATASVGFCAAGPQATRTEPEVTRPAGAATTTSDAVPTTLGYYRMPAIRSETIVFVAEGDLWRVDAKGGSATRLTSHAGEERDPSISPDGQTLAFTATYEGPREVYTIPIVGGLPVRRTWDAGRVGTTAWTPAGTLLYATDTGSDLPAIRTWRHEPKGDTRTVVPLAQCSEAAFLDETHLVFTRLQFQGSHTDRYRGGTAQQLWSFTLPGADGSAEEAKPLTGDYDGTSRRPLAWRDRVVFTTDRSGRMNLWSMKPDGSDLKQHTKHADFDIGSASIDGDRVVYQLGPDLWVHDLARGGDVKLDIHLASDFDQLRERWVKDPSAALSSAHISPDGDRVALTIRGRVFVVPVKQGRVVDADRRGGIRYREAAFMPDGTTLVAISDESGELEIVTLPANGLGAATRKTTDGNTVRWRAVPSPDGKFVAHTDKRQRVWVLNVESGTSALVEENAVEQPTDLTWSHDSRWLAYTAPAANMNMQVKLWSIEGGAPIAATTDRYDSYKPQWSLDGKFLYFLSDRTFESLVGSPWGPRAPEPYYAETGRIFELALKAGTRSPFEPDDEVFKAAEKAKKDAPKETPKETPKEPAKETPKDAPKDATPPDPAKAADGAADAKAKPEKEEKKPAKEPAKVEIDLDGLASRIEQLPVKATNFGSGPLVVTADTIFWMSFTPDALVDGDAPGGGTLMALAIGNEKPEPKPVMSGIRSVELSADGKKFLVRKDRSWFVVDAKAGKAELDKPLDLSGIALSITPRDEWREMMVDAWRLLRDYFYDRKMHGVIWPTVLAKYQPWVDRVRSREELSDIFQEMTGELSALHHFVRGGDLREGTDRVAVATLGADLERDDAAGGWRVTAIPVSDPDEPTARSPLAAPTVKIGVGDVIRSIDGASTLSVPHPSVLLRNKAGRQTLLSVVPKGSTEPRDVIVRPIGSQADANLRYRSWEVSRRMKVEELGAGDIGYVHLRAMGGEDFSDFVRDYYPVFNRKALIIDVRHNRGGNIDSWVLSRLMRKAWMYWNQPAGRGPTWNMQYAFRGHIVVLCNERTASDGEAFSEGFRRLGLGKVMGTRTWGGEIWLSSSNTVVDGGLASAGENGVFDADGVWLIEGRGVEPDVIVDNLPHATFKGEDAQLKAAVEHLKELITKDPRDIPPVPPTPMKSLP